MPLLFCSQTTLPLSLNRFSRQLLMSTGQASKLSIVLWKVSHFAAPQATASRISDASPAVQSLTSVEDCGSPESSDAGLPTPSGQSGSWLQAAALHAPSAPHGTDVAPVSGSFCSNAAKCVAAIVFGTSESERAWAMHSPALISARQIALKTLSTDIVSSCD